jgi:hypothetical protein
MSDLIATCIEVSGVCDSVATIFLDCACFARSLYVRGFFACRRRRSAASENEIGSVDEFSPDGLLAIGFFIEPGVKYWAKSSQSIRLTLDLSGQRRLARSDGR